MTASEFTMPSLDACISWKLILAKLEILVIRRREHWTQDMHGITDFWDARIARQYNRTLVADLPDFHTLFPLVKPRRFLRKIFSSLYGWSRVRETFDHLHSSICVDVDSDYDIWGPATNAISRPSMASGDPPAALSQRYIQPDIEGEKRSIG
jgi:hypothetical protein